MPRKVVKCVLELHARIYYLHKCVFNTIQVASQYMLPWHTVCETLNKKTKYFTNTIIERTHAHAYTHMHAHKGHAHAFLHVIVFQVNLV
jgi:hypothetical protein